MAIQYVAWACCRIESTTSQLVPNYVNSPDEASQAFPRFMRAPLVLRGKPGNEANMYTCTNLHVHV